MSKVSCPYCNQPARYVNKSEVYPMSQEGMMYLCKPCMAWTGVVKGTDEPVGQLANGTLRQARRLAHIYFDHIWQRKVNKGKSKTKTREKAYVWLSKEMGLHRDDTHIRVFNLQQCLKVIEICKPYIM